MVAGLLALMFVVKPGELWFFPQCLFHKWTGLNCPGCGATRALQELLHGNLSAAFHDNALLVLSLPFLAWAGLSLWRCRKERCDLTVPQLWLLLLTMAIFTVWRNLPSGRWLSP